MDAQPSASPASQGEPEGLVAEEEGLSQQESVPAAQEEVTEEAYEEVRLAWRLPAPPFPSRRAVRTTRGHGGL